MGLNDISRSFGHGVGTLVGTTRKVFSWPRNTLRNAVEKLRSIFPSAKVRAIVTEEMMRLMGQENLSEAKLEQRLQAMAETILALRERLDELTAGGRRISETDMLEAMDSLKAAASLTDSERSLLANVFRQNIAIQKPELVGATVGSDMSEGI